MSDDNRDGKRFWKRHVTRRRLLTGAATGAVGLTAAAVVGCGDDEEEAPAATASARPAGTGPASPVSSPAASGGVKYPDPGISDTEIKIGQSIDLSGPASQELIVVNKLQAAYFRYVNEELGGVNGRKINFITYDDGIQPDRFVANVRRLFENDKVFAIIGVAQSEAAVSAVADYAGQNKLPIIMNGAGLSTWQDAKKFPYYSYSLQAYVQEGQLLAEDMLKEVKDPKVGVLVLNDPLGLEYVTGLRKGFGQKADSIIVSEQKWVPTDTNVDTQIIALRNSGANIFFSFAFPAIQIMALNRAFQLGWKPKLYVTPHGGGTFVLKQSPPEIAKGARMGGVLKTPSDPALDKDPGVQLYRKVQQKYYADIPDPDFANGYLFGALGVNALKLMKEPSRAGLMEAVRTFPAYDSEGLALPGVVFQGSRESNYVVKTMALLEFNGELWKPLGQAKPLPA